MDTTDIVPVMTIWREASGEGYTGMLAVAFVIRNRVVKRGMTPIAVCLQPWQFSSMTANGDAALLHWPKDGDPAIALALLAWDNSALPGVLDPTQGADFYFADGIPEPKWAEGYEHTVDIGRQHFYRS